MFHDNQVVTLLVCFFYNYLFIDGHDIKKIFYDFILLMETLNHLMNFFVSCLEAQLTIIIYVCVCVFLS